MERLTRINEIETIEKITEKLSKNKNVKFKQKRQKLYIKLKSTDESDDGMHFICIICL